MSKAFDPLNTALDKPLLIEASAGTGKTYSLMHLILRVIVENKTPLERILIVTFTNNATYELKSRLRARLSEVYNNLQNPTNKASDKTLADQIKIWKKERNPEDLLEVIGQALSQIDDASVFTIHSFCQKMIQQYAFSSKDSFDLEIDNSSNLDTKVIDEVVRSEVKKISNPQVKLEFLHTKEFGRCLKRLSALPRQMIQANNIRFDVSLCESFNDEKKDANIEELRNAFSDFLNTAPEKLRELKKQNHVFSYDDILVRMAENLLDKDFVKSVSDTYDAVLIDEFQDTDPVQYSIFKAIFLDNPKKDRPVIFVGDPKQSIYSFRSADIESYFDARDFIKNTQELTCNYRSTPGLVVAANIFFSDKKSNKVFINNKLDYSEIKYSNNLLPLFKKEGNTFKPVTPFELWLEEPSEQFSPYSGKNLTKEEEERKAAGVEGLEDWAVAEDIAELLSGKYYLGGPDRPLRNSDIVVLVRARKHAKGLIKKLAERHIRCLFDDNEDILDSKESSEILSILRAIEDPSLNKNMIAARSTRIFGEALSSIMKSETARLKARLALEQASKTFSTKGILAAFTEIFNEYSVTDRLLEQSGGERALTNYQHILEVLHKQNRRIKTISGLIRWLQKKTLSEEEQKLRRESDADLIRIETIHKAKGLEYPVVYLLRASLGRKGTTLTKLSDFSRQKDQNGKSFFWLRTKYEDTSKIPTAQMELEEGARFIYVAFTRASSRLVIPMFYKRTKPKNGCSLITREGMNGMLARVVCPEADTNILHARLFKEFPKAFEAAKAQIQTALRNELNNVDCPFYGLVSPGDIDNYKAGNIDWNYGIFSNLKHKTTVQIPPAPNLAASEPAHCEIDWIQTSFTHLTKNLPWAREVPALDEGSDEDVDIVPTEQGIPTGTDLLSFKPIGTSALTYGSFLHSILEKIDFSLARDVRNNRKKISSLVRKELIRFSIADTDEHVSAITEMLGHVLQVHAFKDMPSFRLCDLDSKDKVSEMEFLITIGKPKPGREILNAKTLGKMLEDLDAKSYGGLELSDLELKGYLTGSIDLAFLAEGKFWIIDWKSNLLSENLDSYQGKFLDDAMKAKHYKLQYLLYTVALKRFLEVRLGIDNGYDKIGGIAYFFLRGVHLNHPHRGIFSDKPKKHVIDCLDDVLANGYSADTVKKYLSMTGDKNG